MEIQDLVNEIAMSGTFRVKGKEGLFGISAVYVRRQRVDMYNKDLSGDQCCVPIEDLEVFNQ